MDGRATEPLSKDAPILRDHPEQHAASDPRRVSLRCRECCREKARYEGRRKLRRPQPCEQIGSHCPSFGFAAASGLQLDIRADAEFSEERHSFLQSGYALPGKGRPEPASRVEASNRCERERDHLAPPIRRALEPTIMKQDDLAVRSEANVKFDPSATERLCFAQPGERVFGRACGGTAVADHGRE